MAVPYMVMGILLNKYKKTQERKNYYILALPLILVFMISETLILGNIILITIPGNPAPLPISHKLSTLFKSITLFIVKLS